MIAAVVVAAAVPLVTLAISKGADLRPQTSEARPQQKISPHLKAARDRALEPKPEHKPNLRLSNRGAQKVGR